MLNEEQGAAMHGQIAMALDDLKQGLVEVASTRLRRLQELVDDVVPDVDAAPPTEITVYLLGEDDGPDMAGLVYDTQNEAIESALDNGGLSVWKIDGMLLPGTATQTWTNDEAEDEEDADV